MELLNPSIWKDWQWKYRDTQGYLPSIYAMRLDIASNREAMVKAVSEGRPELWELGNEPELNTSFIAPKTAVAFCKEWQERVGRNFAAPGIIMYRHGLVWLEQYLADGGPIGDYWNIHIYFATDAKSWAVKWDMWCAWMEEHNLVRPTLISETCGMNSPVAAQKEIMSHIAGVLRTDSRLHAALWYSDADWWQLWPESNLRTEAGELTELGRHYLSLTRGES